MKNIEINRHQPYYRIFEILPGFITWSIFIVPVILALYAPQLLAVIIIIYAVYWLLKALIMSARLIVGYKQYKKDAKKDWTKLLTRDYSKNWKNIYHLIITTTYKESFETLKYSLDAIARSDYPKNKIIFVLASEERAAEIGKANARRLKKEFGDKFFHFAHFEHPKDLPGEVVGKGPNVAYAGHQILKFVRSQKIKPENIIVTTLDSDHRPHEKYLAALTYAYLSSPDKKHKAINHCQCFLIIFGMFLFPLDQFLLVVPFGKSLSQLVPIASEILPLMLNHLMPSWKLIFGLQKLLWKMDISFGDHFFVLMAIIR